MKQNSSIMFHRTRRSLIFRYLRHPHDPRLLGILALLSCISLKAAEPPPYAAYYSAEKGFKPVQPNLSKVFLQLAGSLECFGSPEPYIRHIIAEHARIDTKEHARGRTGSSRPTYFTDEYVENLIKNWNKISPPLKLDAFSRDAGRNIRYAILGSKNMAVSELVGLEKALSESEQKAYCSMLEKPFFSKADFPTMDAFYSSTFDKLTETGKDQISRRTKLGTLSPEARKKELDAPISGTALVELFNDQQDKTVAFLDNPSNPKATADTLQRDLIGFLKLRAELDLPKGARAFDAEPLIYANRIREEFTRRVISVRNQIKPEKEAEVVVMAMQLMLENLIVVAQSEYEAGLYERASHPKK